VYSVESEHHALEQVAALPAEAPVTPNLGSSWKPRHGAAKPTIASGLMGTCARMYSANTTKAWLSTSSLRISAGSSSCASCGPDKAGGADGKEFEPCGGDRPKRRAALTVDGRDDAAADDAFSRSRTAPRVAAHGKGQLRIVRQFRRTSSRTKGAFFLRVPVSCLLCAVTPRRMGGNCTRSPSRLARSRAKGRFGSAGQLWV